MSKAFCIPKGGLVFLIDCFIWQIAQWSLLDIFTSIKEPISSLLTSITLKFISSVHLRKLQVNHCSTPWSHTLHAWSLVTVVKRGALYRRTESLLRFRAGGCWRAKSVVVSWVEFGVRDPVLTFKSTEALLHVVLWQVIPRGWSRGRSR
jgi:hypothetical protein